MPGIDAARGFPNGVVAGGFRGVAPRDAAALRRQEAAAPKMLYAVDARYATAAGGAAGSPVTDVAELTSLASAAVAKGGGHVLDTSRVVFPNGAITLVLILAESHLSIHTWPEENLVAIDLFSCGAIDGEAVLGELTGGLALTEVTVRDVPRGLPPSGR